VISVTRDGPLVKIAPAVLTLAQEYGAEDLAQFAGLPATEARELSFPVLLGRAAGAMAADIADAMIREWRERDDAQERNVHTQRKGTRRIA